MTVNHATAGSSSAGYLSAVSSTAVDLTATLTVDSVPNGGGLYASVIGRRVSGSNYKAKVQYRNTGQVSLQITRSAGGTETVLQNIIVPNLTLTGGEPLRLRLQVTGTGTTSVQAKLWKQGQTEPTAWMVTATDTTAALQVAGQIGYDTYLSGSTTTLPVVFHLDDLVVTPTQ
ncbi:hypothetical protein [Tersicoccus sp. Bi-70]|uniref:hypothetical protein n=1 Tax=Tersicoccus sp. Bi-70 TaxID=1897634 RepID=UPI0011817593|nr:hypothetical protein [Tersicoccus sp. Bi-70]